MQPTQRGVSRREFVKAAVAIGGSAALSACLERESPDLATGDPSSVPDRQHAWNEALPRDDHGNVRIPRHHALLLVEYSETGVPDVDAREAYDRALELARAYPPGDPDAIERERAAVVETLEPLKVRFAVANA